MPFSYFIAPISLSLTTLFSISTTGVTVHSASLSSSSSISVSLEFTFYKLLASLAGEHGDYFEHALNLCLCECALKFIHISFVLFCFTSGWIAALTGLNTSIPVGIIMLLIAALFTALSVGSLIMFKKVTQSQSTPNMSASIVVFNKLDLKCEKPNDKGKNSGQWTDVC